MTARVDSWTRHSKVTLQTPQEKGIYTLNVVADSFSLSTNVKATLINVISSNLLNKSLISTWESSSNSKASKTSVRRLFSPKKNWNVKAWDGLVQPIRKYCSIRRMKYKEFQIGIFGRIQSAPWKPHYLRGTEIDSLIISCRFPFIIPRWVNPRTVLVDSPEKNNFPFTWKC